VLRLIAPGKPTNWWRAILSITEETVKGHVKSILSKLGASDRTHAVTIALKRGIIESSNCSPLERVKIPPPF